MLGKIKRSTADKHMSDCVRIRAKWHCQRCGTDYTNRDKRGFQNSHFMAGATTRSGMTRRTAWRCA